jgi:hypothetical protein
MTKNKKFELDSLKLSFHPLLQKQLAADSFRLEKQGDINCIDLKEIQFILDSRPISVCRTKHKNMFELLELSPLFEIFRYHDQSNKLKVSLNIYDADDARRIITSLSITRLALEYPISRHTPQLLFQRHQQAVQMDLTPLTKKELSEFAQVTAAALRAPKKKR